MKPNRRLNLRREVMSGLEPDELRSVAAGRAVARDADLTPGCPVIAATIICVPSDGILRCPTSVDPNSCDTLFC